MRFWFGSEPGQAQIGALNGAQMLDHGQIPTVRAPDVYARLAVPNKQINVLW